MKLPKRIFGAQSGAVRRAALLGTALMVTVLSCGREPTGARSLDGVRLAHLSLGSVVASPEQHALFQTSGITLDNVHIVLRNADGVVVLDTVVTFPPGSDQVSVVASIPVRGATEQFHAQYDLRSGSTVMYSAAQELTVHPGDNPAASAPTAVFVGPGARAVRVTVTPPSGSILAGGTLALAAVAVDDAGAAIPGAPIAWATNDATIAAVTANGGSATVTAQNRRASATISAATLSGITGSATVAVVLPAARLVLEGGDGQTGPVGLALTGTLRVQVQAVDGVGVPGQAVNFTALTANAAVGSASATSDADGRASTTMILGRTPGANQFRANAGAFSVTANATAAAGPASAIAKVSGDAQVDTVGRTLAAPFVVRITDSFGNAAPSATLTWARTGGAGSLVSTVGTAGADGQAQSGYQLGMVPGSEAVSATIAGGAAVTFAATAIARPASRILATGGTPQSGIAGTAAPAPLSVRVTDALAFPVPNTVVTWTTIGAAVAAPSSLTDSDGRATIAATFATRAGAATVTASISGGAAAPFSLTSRAGPAAVMTIVAGNGQSAPAGSPVPIAPSVVVTDQYANPIVGGIVTFTITSGGGSFTGQPVVTSGAGGATLGAWNLGGTPGPNTMLAALGAVSATFTATGTAPTGPPPATTLTITGGNAQSAFAGQLLPTSLSVTVTNALAAGVPGATVTWAAATGGGSVAAPTSVTNASGVATITWTLGATTGPQTATATVAGLTGSPATFTATAAAFVFTRLTAGAGDTCGLITGGAAYCWGENSAGTVGDGTAIERHNATPVTGGLLFASLSAGNSANCGLVAGGTAYCWGFNGSGQVGDGTTTGRNTPTLVAGGLLFASITAGASEACGFTTGGAAYCWGYNFQGQVGNGTATPPNLTPTPAGSGVPFVSITNGAQAGQLCGLITGGTAYCWGSNISGEVGDGTTTTRLIPTPVLGGLLFASLATGNQFTCGVIAGGAAYCWGRNDYGQLSDGTTTPHLTPAPVGGGLLFASVSAGSYHACGLTAGGAAYCWGENGNGSVGDGTTTNRLTPTPVAGGLVFASISAANGFTCGLTTAGKAYCWGSNGWGQLGDGTTTPRSVPTAAIP